MLKQRVLSAIVFVPLFLAIAYLGGKVFDLFLVLILALAGYEYTRMLASAGYQVSHLLVTASIVTVTVLRSLSSASLDFLGLTAILAVLVAFALWKYEHGDQQAFHCLAFQFFGVYYIGVLGAYGIRLNHSGPDGNLWVLVTIGLVWLVDAGAYFFGTRFGKNIVLPRLSPKKTLEGFLGGTLVGVMSGGLIGLIFSSIMPELGALKGALLGLLMGTLAFFGDALMSLLKRTVEVKDTGALLPGHGGVLDRLDSMLWAMAAGTYFAIFIGPL